MFRAYVAWGRSLRCPRALGLIPGCSNGSDAGGPFRCIPPIGNPLRARALAWDWNNYPRMRPRNVPVKDPEPFAAGGLSFELSVDPPHLFE